MLSTRLRHLPLMLALTLLAGCDLLGIESAQDVAARKDAEGRAIGSACRHAARALEDCFALNRKADKAAVFAGWREMNDYMRENKIEPVVPQLGTATAGAESRPAAAEAPAAKASGHDSPTKAGAGDKTAKGNKAGAHES